MRKWEIENISESWNCVLRNTMRLESSWTLEKIIRFLCGKPLETSPSVWAWFWSFSRVCFWVSSFGSVWGCLVLIRRSSIPNTCQNFNRKVYFGEIMFDETYEWWIHIQYVLDKMGSHFRFGLTEILRNFVKIPFYWE